MARTTETRRPRGRTAPAPAARPIVRDYSGPGPRAEVIFDPRTAYDFVISMNVAAGDEADLLPEDATWLRDVRASLPTDMLNQLDSCFGDESAGAFHALPSVAVARPDVIDAKSFVAALDDITPEGVARMFLDDILRHADGPDLADRILSGDEDALVTAKAALDEYHKGNIMGFLRDPREGVDRMRAVVGAWLPLYQQVEPRVAQMIERDVAARQGDRETLDQTTLIERTTGGLRWLPESHVRRVIMAPSYFARPYNYIYQGGDWRLFAYPIADAALGAIDAGIPPQSVVRLYRALGDGTRMRILKLLADRDWYLTELAQRLELSKPTMKHHLALLRAAGLVTVTEEGSLTYYSLRRERLQEAGVELHRFLA